LEHRISVDIGMMPDEYAGIVNRMTDFGSIAGSDDEGAE
jgi:hypothetical protein